MGPRPARRPNLCKAPSQRLESCAASQAWSPWTPPSSGSTRFGDAPSRPWRSRSFGSGLRGGARGLWHDAGHAGEEAAGGGQVARSEGEDLRRFDPRRHGLQIALGHGVEVEAGLGRYHPLGGPGVGPAD